MKTTEITSREVLQTENESLQRTVTSQAEELTDLREQLAWFQRQVFGKRSERVIGCLDTKQLMFEGFDTLDKTPNLKTKEIAAHSRKKPRRDGQDKITLPADLPVETLVLDIPESEKICKITGVALEKIGEEVSHKLAYRPGSFYVKEIIRLKYANPKQAEMGVVVADLPENILPRCRADASFLAHIITEKFANHMPLYRQSESFEREGVSISRKLLSQWVVAVGLALRPLYEEMLKKILGSGNVFIDESPVKVLAKGKCIQGYMWVIVGGSGPNPPYRVYDFREDRCHKHAFEILASYRGVVHSDKYGAYETLAKSNGIVWSPCWVHIRRKFFDAESGDLEFRAWVLRKIRYLFMLEKVAWARSQEERLRIRREKEIPIIDEIVEKTKSQLVNGKVLPKSKFREALGYLCNLIPHLKNYTKYADARLDNNVAERAVRPLALGRKNWMFFGSMDGGKAGGILLSLVQTCRGIGINPREYLEDIFRRLMSHNANKLEELLPDQWQLARTQPLPYITPII